MSIFPLDNTVQFEADYYDGISPRAKRVLVTIQEPYFLFTIDNTIHHRYSINNCTIQAKLGKGKRLIDLPDASRLETDFQELERYLPTTTKHGFWRIVHYAENHKLLIFLCLQALIAITTLLMVYGVPLMAQYAVDITPVNVEKHLGKYTLDTLDHNKLGYFAKTTLALDRQNAIKTRLVQLCQKINCPDYQLNFRKSPSLGANAFALPGGDIVITDELIALTHNDDEIIAVLAHELAHVKHRHALRQTLQGSLSGLIIVSITGDASSLAANLPIVMINTRYSRDLETEADLYALHALKTTCIPTNSFASILLKLEKVLNKTSISIPEIISSHPDTKARILPFIKEKNSACISTNKTEIEN